MILNRDIKNIIKSALKEDIGREDITTLLTIPYHFKVNTAIIAKEDGVLCGIDIVKRIFKLKRNVKFIQIKKDGDKFKKNDYIAYINGEARSILPYERVALNFLSFLSGVATTTANFVEKIKNTNVKILDTRKTIPNLRILQKYAVKIGGGFNHRKALSDAILIKDNHLRAGKYIKDGKLDEERLAKCLYYLRNFKVNKIEIEIENFEEFKKVIKYTPDIIMLDNFPIKEIKRAVEYRNKYYPNIKLEASGGINLDNVLDVAKTGVDYISIGALTHSVKAIDFSLEVL